MRNLILVSAAALAVISAASCGLDSDGGGGNNNGSGTSSSGGSGGNAGSSAGNGGDTNIWPDAGNGGNSSNGGAGQAGNAGSGGNTGSGGSGDGGSLDCDSTTLNAPQSVAITSSAPASMHGVYFRSFSGTEQYSQTSPSPVALGGNNFPAQLVQVGANNVSLTFSYAPGSITPVHPTYYFFQPNALPHAACTADLYSQACLKAVVDDFRCQFQGQNSNCPAQSGTFTPQQTATSYNASGSGTHGVLAQINCP